IAWFMLEAINRGYVATVQWDCYDAHYDRLMHYGLIDDVYHDWKLKPAYHVLRLFTHTAAPGWRAVPVYAAPGQIRIAALRSDDGDLSIYALNRDDKERTVRIRIAEHSDLFATTWIAGQLGAPALLRARRDGAFEITLPPASLVALTTLRPAL